MPSIPNLSLWLPKRLDGSPTKLWPDRIFPVERQQFGDVGSRAAYWVRRSSSQLIRAYEDGCTGVLLDPAARERLHDTFRQTGGYVQFSDAAHASGIAGSFVGQLVVPFINMLECWPGCLPGAAQERGDCFAPETPVVMEDGRSVPIASVQPGQKVLTPLGNRKTVLRRVDKRYRGDLVRIVVGGSGVWATPDHRFVTGVNDRDELVWLRAGEAASGDSIVMRSRGPGRVERISRVDGGFVDGHVHCLEVQDDHLFLPGEIAASNCVSHASSGAARLSIAGDIMGGLPDPRTGVIEGIPFVDPAGIIDGVTSSEYQYWWRGYNGDGWSCETAMEVAIKRGIMLRNNYPDLGIDLRNYSGSLAGRYGSRQPPPNIEAVGSAHPIQTGAEISGSDMGPQIRDALGNLYGIQHCGGEAWSSVRDANGFSRRSGGWSHGFKAIGYDDRESIKRLYGEPLVLLDNNWGVWNSGPRDIYQSAPLVPARKRDLWIKLGVVNPQTGNIMIPPGSWWALLSSVRNRWFGVYAGITGWAKKPRPSYGGSIFG